MHIRRKGGEDMDIREYMRENTVVLDGAMGSLLMERGLKPGERGERWNLSHPEEIVAVHRAYFDAGSNVVITNTFGATRLHFSPEELSEIVPAAVKTQKHRKRQPKGRYSRKAALQWVSSCTFDPSAVSQRIFSPSGICATGLRIPM